MIDACNCLRGRHVADNERAVDGVSRIKNLQKSDLEKATLPSRRVVGRSGSKSAAPQVREVEEGRRVKEPKGQSERAEGRTRRY